MRELHSVVCACNTIDTMGSMVKHEKAVAWDSAPFDDYEPAFANWGSIMANDISA